jgi:hypothetical protein
MIRITGAIVICISLLSLSPATSFAKNHSGDYKLGALIKVPLHVGGKVSTGYTDTTSCSEGLFGVHCTGGVVDDYGANLVADMPDGNEVVIEPCASGATLAALLLPCSKPFVLMLIEEDGSTIFLGHTWGYHDSAKDLETNSKVLYRVEHHAGVTYVKIPDPNNPDKEGSYNPIKLPKQKTKGASANQSGENVTAMCASGKLSPELQAKYCTNAK